MISSSATGAASDERWDENDKQGESLCVFRLHGLATLTILKQELVHYCCALPGGGKKKK